MNCPVCKSVSLVMSERQGIEIDYCPQCRGVWLDRGELDKIIEKSAPASQAKPLESNSPPQQNTPNYGQQYQSPSGHQPQSHYGHQHHGGHYKKKKGFLSEIFDFD